MSEIDITPSPRILRTLGEIPFQVWQCVAELADNSLDAFTNAGDQTSGNRIVVSWSSDDVPTSQWQIEVIDNGPGMTSVQLQDAVRAGYSSNDAINNLGLFGMGFNIATARLGDRTRFYTATATSSEWVGVEIDFAALTARRRFTAPLIALPKTVPGEHGSRIVVDRLRQSIIGDLRTKKSRLIEMLETIYSPILSRVGVEFLVQSHTLKPRSHCVWDKNRYVLRRRDRVPAVIEINEDLGEAFFDQTHSRYLSEHEADELSEGDELPSGVVRRRKRVHGWLGIQRHADPNAFGIDFIRNGRKILIQDKALFSYFNPYTQTNKLEYPLELGGTIGGRIVGEIHVDHLHPNFQKTGFDNLDQTWREVVECLRGDGPILEQDRAALGLSKDVISPLGQLMNAYRRVDQGTKCLFILNSKAKDWAKEFQKRNPAYQTDEKWFEAATLADRDETRRGGGRRSPVDAGTDPTDDPDSYGPANSTPVGGPQPNGGTTVQTLTLEERMNEIIARSQKRADLSGRFAYSNSTPALEVEVYELRSGVIEMEHDEVPCFLHSPGLESQFFFNPRHDFFQKFPASYKDPLFLGLAEKFKARDSLPDLVPIYVALHQRHNLEAVIDRSVVQEKANTIFREMREAALMNLAQREMDAISCVHESAGEVEEIAHRLAASASDLLGAFQRREPGSIRSLAYVPQRTLIRLFERFPEEFFDGKFLRIPYSDVSLPDANSTERIRTGLKERRAAYLKDALWALTGDAEGSGVSSKDELLRCWHSITILGRELAT